jgi:hypothetical protein
MEGVNTLIISQEEMVRAVNKYLNELMFSHELGNARAISVRQKGARLENRFIIEIKKPE